MYAIHSNNFELIKILEENNVKPKDETYHQCFYESIKCHHNELSLYIMNNFIKDEAKPNDKELFFKYYNFKFIECNDMTDTNLLFISCKYNYIYNVKVLLEKASIDINAKYEKNSERNERMTVTKIKKLKTALIIALEKGSIDIAKLLLTNENIDVNIPGQYFSLEDEDKKRYRKYDSSNSPLTLAIENGYAEIAKLLLSRPGIDVNSEHVIKDSHLDCMENKSALFIAIEENDLDIVKLLLANPKINVNYVSKSKIPFDNRYVEKTTLCAAIGNGNIEIIRELLSSKDIDINSTQSISVEYPYEEDSNATCKTISYALNLAIYKENADIVKLLISHPKISINDQSLKYFEYMSNMSSFTEYKMGGGWYYIMPLLHEVIDHPGRDFEVKIEENIPALCYAISNEQFEIAKIILSSDQCNVNDEITKNSYTFKKDEYDRSSKRFWSPCAKTKISALCLAVEKNNVEIVNLLLSSPKIDVNAKFLKESYKFESKEEEEGEEEENNDYNKKEIAWIHEKEVKSPLHIAVCNSNKEIIELLLQKKGIDLDQVDDQNKKAIDYAKDDGIKKLFQ